jgi:hypothetical protein
MLAFSVASGVRSNGPAVRRSGSSVASWSRCTGAARCAAVVGIDARLAEIDDLLHPRRNAPHCECGVPIMRGSHFCPNCGRAFEPADADPSDETIIQPASVEDV